MAKKLNFNNFCGKYGASRGNGYRAPITSMIAPPIAAEPLTDLIVLNAAASEAYQDKTAAMPAAGPVNRLSDSTACIGGAIIAITMAGIRLIKTGD